ncbi:glycosyl transferase [Methylobacillus gramineus]|uniref:glycosyl transferase n=1 Tax=Methylobacillus gramineus TaxID=755169 RepID=UPI001CFFDA0F|nr:glycosyl transferase [Methylobacillus gramineus]MCB5184127.1 glycosyl transferase [Methylobacillus gramineus]
MDQEVHEQLEKLQLPHVSLMRLADFESQALLDVKSSRSKAEYCWTITPFTAEWVFSRDVKVERVTYLDADLLFYKDPSILFQEFEQSGKHVMITEHAYAPEYFKYLESSGRFCVQFMVFDRSDSARVVMQWWQARCLEWCYARLEDGKFGDQKYLDVWPEMFAQEIHILKRVEQTLAPWNVDYLLQGQKPGFKPVFFHFHAFRIIAPDCVKLFEGYRIASTSRYLYDEYLTSLRLQCKVLHQHDIPLALLPERHSVRSRLRSWLMAAKGLSVRVRINTSA